MEKNLPTIENLYKEDISQRNHINWDSQEQVRELEEKDRKRRETARKIVSKGLLISGLDYYHASLIFQHGETTEDYKLAHELAEKAVDLGDETARWLYAATYDRWLLSEGKPQRYGTQFKQNEQGEWELAQPIDPSITDDERARYGVPPLSQALRVYKERYKIK